MIPSGLIPNNEHVRFRLHVTRVSCVSDVFIGWSRPIDTMWIYDSRYHGVTDSKIFVYSSPWCLVFVQTMCGTANRVSDGRKLVFKINQLIRDSETCKFYWNWNATLVYISGFIDIWCMISVERGTSLIVGFALGRRLACEAQRHLMWMLHFQWVDMQWYIRGRHVIRNPSTDAWFRDI